MSPTRRLAAILAADVAGYSRLMGADEEGTLERLKALRRELVGREEIVTRLRAITSVVIPDAGQHRNAEHRELLVSGLRMAAGEAP